MENRKLRSGSKQSLETFLDNVQSDAAANITNRIKQLFGSFGLILNFKSGSDLGNSFVTSVQGSSNEQLDITAGKAITSSGEYINFQGQTKDWSSEGLSAGTYVVKLQYTLLGSDPVTVMNAFLFDSTGGEQHTDRQTKFSDGSKVVLSSVGADIDATISALNEDEVAVGIVKILANGTFDVSSWSFDGTTASGGVIDVRDKNRLSLNTFLFDDSKFMFKDRNSTGDYAVTGDVEFDSTLYHKAIQSISGQATSIETGEFTTDQIIMTTGNEASTNIEGTTATTFTVNGQTVLTGDGTLLTPTNLRIYDINPGEVENVKESLVSFKWNWDALNGENGSSSNEFIIYDNTFDGETIDLSSGNVVGRLLYFSNTGNSYEITNVTSGTNEFTLTVDGTISGSDGVSSGSPARIIDSNATSYTLTLTNTANNRSQIYTLGEDYVTDPSFKVGLRLGQSFSASIKAYNTGNSSSVHTMQAGSYDPDHSSGGQTSVNYGSSFLNELPDISTTGSLTLTADTQGFVMEIGGWTDGGDPTNSAHEFEVVYSDSTDVTESDFGNVGAGISSVQHFITQAGKQHVSTGNPTKYSVGIRPLQNRQAVDTPIIKEVTSGGGGVSPSDDVLISEHVDIKNFRFDITADNGSGDFSVLWYDSGGTQIYPSPGMAEGRWATELDGSNVPIENSDFQIAWHRDYDVTVDSHRIQIRNPGSLTTGDSLQMGVSREAREIHRRSLQVDYRVTKIEFKAHFTDDTSQTDPAIIRVYQQGFENSAATVEVPGTQQETWSQVIDLPIKLASDGTRILIADAWDPDTGSPNNDCAIKGNLVITGKPIVTQT